MSVKVIAGNIFTSKCQTIVNTVNCVGVMGAGIALECRLRYPDLYIKYVQLCEKKQIDIGLLWIYKAQDRWILNFPTKKHWKYPSKLEYLHAGLQKFTETYERQGVKSIAFPLLGADKGGIPQEQSLDIILSHLNNIDLEVEVYRYDPTAKDDLFETTKAWLLSQNASHISEATSLRKDYVAKLILAIQDPMIFQLNQLARVNGIGIKTLERVFFLAKHASDVVYGGDSTQQSLL